MDVHHDVIARPSDHQHGFGQYVPRRRLDARARRPVTAPDNEWNHISVAREATRLANEGVNVQIGAHGQREGLAAHWEMWSLAQGGMPAHDVLRAGTLNGARSLGLDRDIGSLEPGKLADLVVLSGDFLAVSEAELAGLVADLTVVGGQIRFQR